MNDSFSREKILVTSALPYVNNIPHLGTIIGCVLSADVFARYARLRGKETLFVCGSDEHGTATETKARQEGLSPKQLCDKYYAIHKEIYEWFNISFDIFGRTSAENHHEITQELFKKVNENGFIEKKSVQQPYCHTCNAFLADRFIIGTCPHCGYEEAKGDQCDSCGKLLTPKELIKPVCKQDGATPEFKSTEHLFLRLDTLEPFLKKWFEQTSKEGGWTDNSIRNTRSWFKKGLHSRAISRDLKWGIPIPYEGFEDKVFYVWFDAPIGYISLTQQLTDEWKEWWYDPETVSLYQFMGKDNIPFHSIIFPATQIASQLSSSAVLDKWNPSDLDIVTVSHLNATEYINYEHGKFSKSKGVGIFGDTAKDSGIPADVFRYVLLYNRPESSDTQFTWKGLQERLNNELVANFGNLVNRTMTFISKYCDGVIADIDESSLSSQTIDFLREYKKEIAHYNMLMESVRIRESVVQLMKISSLGNHFFQESKPWKTIKETPDVARKDLFILANIVKDLAILSKPFMPETSQSIYKQLGISPRDLSDVGVLSVSDHTIGVPSLLFEKIDSPRIKELQDRFSGNNSQENISNEPQQKPQEKKSSQNTDSNSSFIDNLELKAGNIVDVKKHPKADKLYIEEVDFGDGKTTQIVSGLVPHYTSDELLGKTVVVVTNLKPAKLRGEWSNGMVLAAQDSSTGTVGLILADKSSCGKRIITSDNPLPPKKQVTFDDFMNVSFALKDGVVYADDNPLKVLDGENVFADRLENGEVR
ncbi:MAG: methionine--tRNA ligase [Nanobdellota archaeon]